jgi:hypothetical protein
MKRGRYILGTVLFCASALANGSIVRATGVPISGFYPFAGISLTTEHEDEDDPTFTFFYSDYETSYVGTPLGVGGPHFELALVDTGAATTLITSAADAAFNIQAQGYRGTADLPIGGATGLLVAKTNDPMAIYASGVGPPNRTGTAPLTLNTGLMVGQSSISLATLPPESDLPSILGVPFSSQYAMYIRNDQPQMFSLGGKTVRTPQLEFKELGSGGQGIVRRVPMTFGDNSAFLNAPQYTMDFANIIAEPPVPWTDNPLYPTFRLGSAGQPSAALFVNVNVSNEGNNLTNTPFLLDTGADVSVVSEINAVHLGFDPVLDTPDFTVAVLGSGGLLEEVPGFYVDQFTIPAVGGSITLTHVPFIVLDFPNPSQVGNVAQGLIGMNALAGRNVVIDPNPATGGGGNSPSMYVSDPVTQNHSWSNVTASGAWSTTGNWNASGTPDILWIANVRNVSGSPQEAVVSANSSVWELNVSGTGPATMTVRVGSGVTLSTFSGANIEAGGKLRLDGGTLDASFVDIRGGTLTGTGIVTTGSGPIAGQVENHGGVVAPGNGVGTLSIVGRFANAADGTLAVELGGMTAGTQHDQLIVTGAAALKGTLSVSLVDLGGGAFVPAVGNTFTIITTTEGVGGQFSSIQGPDGWNWRVINGLNNVQLKVDNPGDFNFDGTVNGADYVVWRNNGMGPLNYAAWRSSFGTTYGSGSGFEGGGVPEPAAFVMLSLAVCGVALKRRRFLLSPLGPERRFTVECRLRRKSRYDEPVPSHRHVNGHRHLLGCGRQV